MAQDVITKYLSETRWPAQQPPTVQGCHDIAIRCNENLMLLVKVIIRYMKTRQQYLQSVQSACNFLMSVNI